MTAGDHAEIDLLTIMSAPDPYVPLRILRCHNPVTMLPSGFCAITGYDAALEAMHHPTLTSGPIGRRYFDALPPGAARNEMSNRINFLDPPDHPRVRGIVSKAFTPRRMAELAPWIRATTVALIGTIDTSARFDALHRFAHIIPSLVISELLGIPTIDRHQLTAWSDAVAPLLGAVVTSEAMTAAITAAEHFHSYLDDLVSTRSECPSTDLVSALVAAEHDGANLTRPELLSLAATLYSAGHRTTRDSLANGFAHILAPVSDVFSQLVAGELNPSDVASEILRHQTPTLYVGRVASADCVIADTTIVATTPVLIFLGAANRDPAKYDDPESFRVGGAGPAPLSFAHGAHFCLGASLARTEIEIMLELVASHWPTLHLSDEPLRWHQRGPFRGLDELIVQT